MDLIISRLVIGELGLLSYVSGFGTLVTLYDAHIQRFHREEASTHSTFVALD